MASMAAKLSSAACGSSDSSTSSTLSMLKRRERCWRESVFPMSLQRFWFLHEARVHYGLGQLHGRVRRHHHELMIARSQPISHRPNAGGLFPNKHLLVVYVAPWLVGHALGEAGQLLGRHGAGALWSRIDDADAAQRLHHCQHLAGLQAAQRTNFLWKKENGRARKRV